MTQTVNKVIISGGREVGGLDAFANGLAAGFRDQNIPVEVKSVIGIFAGWTELRDPSVLKILSTSAAFAAVFAKNSICVAHGFPRADAQGWIKLIIIILSFKIANRFSRLVAVSEYVAVHLRSIFNLHVDAVIGNTLSSVYLESLDAANEDRSYITYVGRMHPVKNIDRLLPILRDFINLHCKYRVCIIGDGRLRQELESAFQGDLRFEFKGHLSAIDIRYWLRKTKIFISGCETEAFGIAYLEALSQGCAVVMPASGGGMEIVPDLLGVNVFLMPLSFDGQKIVSTLACAEKARVSPCILGEFEPKYVASLYWKIGCSFSSCGNF